MSADIYYIDYQIEVIETFEVVLTKYSNGFYLDFD